MLLRTRALFLASTLALLAAGCEAKFVPTETMKQIQSSLPPPVAAQFFGEALRGTPAGFGLCRAPFRWGDVKGASADPERMAIPAVRTDAGGKEERYVEERSFRDLKKIRFAKGAASRFARPRCASASVSAAGIPRRRAASTIGPATYPPAPRTTSGRRRARIRRAS